MCCCICVSVSVSVSVSARTLHSFTHVALTPWPRVVQPERIQREQQLEKVPRDFKSDVWSYGCKRLACFDQQFVVTLQAHAHL